MFACWYEYVACMYLVPMETGFPWTTGSCVPLRDYKPTLGSLQEKQMSTSPAPNFRIIIINFFGGDLVFSRQSFSV